MKSISWTPAQIRLINPCLYVSDEAEAALALVAAGGDLHHGFGTAADYALHEREREMSGISRHLLSKAR